MNSVTLEDVRADVDQQIFLSKTKACLAKKTLVVEGQSIDVSYLKKDNDLHVIITEGIIPTDTSKVKNFLFDFETYVQYLPFIWKYNWIDKINPNDGIVEMEFNLFGFAKNAICFRRVIMETDDGQPRHYLMYLSVTHPKTQIIPFRDSAMLMQTITLEECSEGCIIRDVAVVSPIPWLQSNDLFESLERFSYISIRRMKSCFDYIFYNKSTDRQLVCDSITLERIGLEATLNDKHDSIGEVCYETKDTRITGVDFVIDHATFICEGCFHKKCQFKLSRESLLELVFQDRCSIIANTTPQTSIVHKRKPKEYNTDNEDLCFSTFIYSESCALVHFQSVYDRNQPRLRQDAPQVYSFKDSYIFVFGCKDEWTIQYNISIIARTKLSLLDEKEAMFAITHFLKNMAKSVDSFHKPDDYKQPMTFLTSHPRDVSPVMQLPFSLLVTICDYLTPKDVLSFSSTCTHIRDSFKYAIQNGICIGGICPKGGTVHQVESPLRTQPSDFDFDECKKKTPEHIKLHGHTNLIRALDIHPSCTMLVSGSSDRKIRLWDLKDNSSRTFVGPNSSLVTTKFTTKHFIASGYRCGTIRYIHSLDSRQSQVFDVKEGTIDGFYPMQQMNFFGLE
ncbi:F-box and WD domain protein [Entamoeba marina]